MEFEGKMVFKMELSYICISIYSSLVKERNGK